MELYLIDAIGPFFKGYKKDTINWSKIPFENIEKDGILDQKKVAQVYEDFEVFCAQVSRLGYNAISIDDLAHLAVFDFYAESLKPKLKDYQILYRQLFATAQKHQLKIFVNTDIAFTHPSIDIFTQKKKKNTLEFLRQCLAQAMDSFPEIDGFIFRLGESDGLDVKGDFLSNLEIETPGQANRYLKALLPLFEANDKTLIFRTWTVGVNKIGDLIWNKYTYRQVFHGIKSPNLVVSFKYGESDFYRFDKINPLIAQSQEKKIIEFQARREREGFGLFPYYVGWEYERYAQEIRKIPNIYGVSVWCQTGGWSNHYSLTYLDKSSVWNELNTFACIKILKEKNTPEDAIEEFFGTSKKTEFIRLFTEMFSRICYIDGLFDQSFYFRRLRIPPLFWKNWDHITINGWFIKVHKFMGAKAPDIAPAKFTRLRKLGEKAQIKKLDFYLDTLKILHRCAKTLTGTRVKNFSKKMAAYQKKYPDMYQFSVEDVDVSLSRTERVLLSLLIRKKSKYRLVDRFFLTRPMSKMIYYFLEKFNKKKFPDFVNKQAMEIKKLFE